MHLNLTLNVHCLACLFFYFWHNCWKMVYNLVVEHFFLGVEPAWKILLM
jgi:hypothetical protein